MEHLVALIIISLSLLLLIVYSHQTPYRFIQSTHRPNKFTSDGDTLHLGTFSRSNFIFIFTCKVNVSQAPFVSFNEKQLLLNKNQIIYDQSVVKLPFSLYELFEWVKISIYSTPTLTVLIGNEQLTFKDSLPNSFALSLGGKGFSGSFAEISINTIPAFWATVPGINQSNRHDVSVAGFNDFGLFGDALRHAKLIRRDLQVQSRASPKISFARDIAFSLNITIRALSDGIYFTIIFENDKTISVGRNITGSKTIDIKDMDVNLFDILTFIVQLSKPSLMIIKNTTYNIKAEKELPEIPTSLYSLQLGDPKICLVTEIIHRDRPVWQAGINFDEQNNTDTIFYMNYTGSYARILNPPQSVPWTCEFQFINHSMKEVCILHLISRYQTFSLSIKGRNIIIRRTENGSQIIDHLEAPSEIQSHLNKIFISFDLYFSIQLVQSGKVIKKTIFAPSAFKLFHAYDILIGALNVLNPTVPDPECKLFLNHILVCNIPFRNLPEKIIIKDTSFLQGSISSIEMEFPHNGVIFSLRTNNTIGIFTRNSDVYLIFNNNELLIDRAMVRMAGTYKFQLKLDLECTLLITNPQMESIAYRFTPILLPTNIVLMKLPAQPCSKAVFLGSVCCL